MEVNTTTTTDPINMYNSVNNIMLNPIVFIILFVIVIIYVIMFASLGKNSSGSNSNSSSFISSEENTNWTNGQQLLGIIIAGVLVFLIIVNAFQYFFNISVSAYINDLFTNKPKIDIIVDQGSYQPTPVSEIKFKKQVFNIPGNYYDYENAKALCTAYGSELASYDQIEKAYKNGGEWCNYGWSKDQMALFPTQQKTYDNLQTIPGHKHDCGRPGINGGYIANPNVRFGANCYGYKPKITEEEQQLMNTTTPYPQSAQDIAFQKRVDFWKGQIDNVLVSPFNYQTWGSI
jgi:hypothetical protein